MLPVALMGGMDRSKLNIGTYYLKPYAQTERHVKEAKDCGIDFFICIDAQEDGSEIELLNLFQKSNCSICFRNTASVLS